MSAERCNDDVYEKDPHVKYYDEMYHNELIDEIRGNVLDIGCGACTFLRKYIKKRNVKSVLGVDKYDTEFYKHKKTLYLQAVIPDELTIVGKFDTIVSTEFIEHIEREKLEPLLEKIKQCLKPDGMFVGSTPNKISPTTNPYHLYEYTLDELKGIFQKYFSHVEMYDNGQFCTIWKVKL